jgi:hypothetical protein
MIQYWGCQHPITSYSVLSEHAHATATAPQMTSCATEAVLFDCKVSVEGIKIF